MVTYSIDDTFCPCGEKWTRVESSLVFGDYYYCKGCDKIYTPTVEEKSKKWFEDNYVSDRRQVLINKANIVEARQKVTLKDLIKLGYLK